MLGKAMARHFELTGAASLDDVLDVTRLAALSPSVPRIVFRHDYKPDFRTADELPRSKEQFRDARVLLLVRDPRDIAVSHYFERRHRAHLWGDIHRADPALAAVRDRLQPFSGTLSEFLRADVGSLQTIIAYYNIWAYNRYVPDRFLIVRYEDLHVDPLSVMQSVLSFLELSVRPEIVKAAIDEASFARMQELERSGAAGLKMLRPGDPREPESFKVRRGKVQGFRDYLSDTDVRYSSELVEAHLSSIYGYHA
jgi:hypothetical protein